MINFQQRHAKTMICSFTLISPDNKTQESFITIDPVEDFEEARVSPDGSNILARCTVDIETRKQKLVIHDLDLFKELGYMEYINRLFPLYDISEDEVVCIMENDSGFAGYKLMECESSGLFD